MKRHRLRVGGRRYRRARKTSGILGVVGRSLAFLLLVSACVIAVRWVEDRAQSNADIDSSSPHAQLPLFGGLQFGKIQSRNRRVVYPYSVVPGGVRSAGELQEAASHDPVVAEHYSGFDYSRAHLVEVREPKLVYLSYRKKGHIYWTHKQASLHVGEKLLTDGHTTARTRCGNQVSVLPQANTSPEEPTIAELDRPDAIATGTEELSPTNLASNLLQVDPGMPLTSSSLGNAFAGGPPPGGFMPLPIGTGGGGLGTPIGGGCPPNQENPPKSCEHNPPPPPPPPPPVVPEPGTIVLMASGIGAILARYRFKG